MAENATTVLREEHQVILAVLECLAALVEDIRQGGQVDTDSVRKSIDFFREFADRWHHAKEEGILFPAMEDKGIPRHGGPIGVMLHEHDIGRGHVRGMEQALAGAGSGDPQARKALIDNALGYIALLQNHIAKENNVLFEMADQALSPEESRRIVEQYASHGSGGAGRGDSGDTGVTYVNLAEELCRRWKVDLRARREPR